MSVRLARAVLSPGGWTSSPPSASSPLNSDECTARLGSTLAAGGPQKWLSPSWPRSSPVTTAARLCHSGKRPDRSMADWHTKRLEPERTGRWAKRRPGEEQAPS